MQSYSCEWSWRVTEPRCRHLQENHSLGEGGGPGFAVLSQGTEKAAGKTGEKPATVSAGSRVWGVEAEPEGGPQPRAPLGLVGPTSRPGETLLGTFRNLSKDTRDQMLPNKDHFSRVLLYLAVGLQTSNRAQDAAFELLREKVSGKIDSPDVTKLPTLQKNTKK